MIKAEIARHPAGDLVGVQLNECLHVLTTEEAQQLADRLKECLCPENTRTVDAEE